MFDCARSTWEVFEGLLCGASITFCFMESSWSHDGRMTRTTNHLTRCMISTNLALASQAFDCHNFLVLCNRDEVRSLNTLIYFLAINLYSYPSHTTFPWQPSLRILIVKRKWWNRNEECQDCTTQAQPKCNIDVLQSKANKEGYQLL